MLTDSPAALLANPREFVFERVQLFVIEGFKVDELMRAPSVVRSNSSSLSWSARGSRFWVF
jgi:hypothetical protein